MTKNRNHYYGTESVIQADHAGLIEPAIGIADRVRQEWDNAGIGNAFIFGKIMTSRPDLLLELLQYSLPEMQIQSICDARREVDVKLSIDAHGVRLDVAVHDNTGRMIDVEMQLKDEKNIPYRMRYYFGAVDQTILESGQEYRDLKDSVIVFITPFDPFGKDLIRYTFRSICIEDKELELGDGTTGVILNAAGTKGNASQELKGFLNLVAGIQTYEKGSFADRLQEQVIRARQNSEWRRQYMDWKMTLLSERSKGREEGLAEGREVGLAEGRQAGLAEGRQAGMLLNEIDLITKKIKRGLELPAIAAEMETEEDIIRPIYDAVKLSAPDYNPEQILRRLLEQDRARKM